MFSEGGERATEDGMFRYMCKAIGSSQNLNDKANLKTRSTMPHAAGMGSPAEPVDEEIAGGAVAPPKVQARAAAAVNAT